MTLEAWRGRLAVGPWWVLYAGSVGTTKAHAHHAYQIVLHEGLSLVERPDADQDDGPLVVVAPDERHAFGRSCDGVVTIYIEPESSAGAALRDPPATGPVPSVTELVGALLPDSWSSADQLVQRILAAVGISDSLSNLRRSRHPAVREALLRLPDLIDHGSVDISALAADIGVSTSRLTHVFTDEVGIPLRSYVRWLRLVTAVERLSTGSTITEAAHAAHFSDGPHFSRVFNDMFGIAPIDVVGAATWIR